VSLREFLVTPLAPPLVPHEADRTAQALRRGGHPYEHFAVLQSIPVKRVRRIEVPRVQEQLDRQQHGLDLLDALGLSLGRLAGEQVRGTAGGIRARTEEHGPEVVAQDRVTGAALTTFDGFARHDPA
jgi:hypothetical protein